MSTARFSTTNEPQSPSAGKVVVYVDEEDKHLKQKDEDGNVKDLTDTSAFDNSKIILEDRTGDEPSHTAGQMFYSDGVVKIQDGFEGITLNIGRDMHIQVINNTGVKIDKGMACRHNGVVDGNVQIALALAESFVHATILGVTAHDILSGETGILATHGVVKGIDTSTNPVGMPLYLSDTVAGTYTHISPVIRTQVGGAKISDDEDGELVVNIVNNVPLPRTLGSLLGATEPTSIPLDLVNGTPIASYDSNIEIVTETNKTTGVVTIPLDGIYRLNISMHMYFDNVGGAGKKEIYLDLVDITLNTTVKSLRGFILKDAETYSMTDNGAVALEAEHEYRMEIRSELALTNFAFSSSTFYIESILY